MNWQRLKLKRIKLKKDKPKIITRFATFTLNNQKFFMFHAKDRIFIKNKDNEKLYELINE